MANGDAQGIDVSHYQGTVDWAALAQAGYRFAFAKATDGLTYVDPQFATNWPAMKAAGLLRGAYHFFEPADDAVTQAQFYLQTVQPTAGDLPPALDVETLGSGVAAATGVQPVPLPRPLLRRPERRPRDPRRLPPLDRPKRRRPAHSPKRLERLDDLATLRERHRTRDHRGGGSRSLRRSGGGVGGDDDRVEVGRHCAIAISFSP